MRLSLTKSVYLLSDYLIFNCASGQIIQPELCPNVMNCVVYSLLQKALSVQPENVRRKLDLETAERLQDEDYALHPEVRYQRNRKFGPRKHLFGLLLNSCNIRSSCSHRCFL